jgi:hypothetical protein
MTVVKRSFSIDPKVWEAVVEAVGPGSGHVSAFVNEALARHARVTLGLRSVAEWEAEHGALPDDLLAEADRVLDAAEVVAPPSA